MFIRLVVFTVSLLASVLTMATTTKYYCIRNSLERHSIYIFGETNGSWSEAAKITSKSVVHDAELAKVSAMLFSMNNDDDQAGLPVVNMHGYLIEPMELLVQEKSSSKYHYSVRLGPNNAMEIFTVPLPGSRDLPYGVLRIDSTTFKSNSTKKVPVRGWTSWNSGEDSGPGKLSQEFCGIHSDS